MATGLAEAGFVPFVYSIATFAALRPYEFIRNGPVLQQLPVRIVGVGGGFDYGHNGATHLALEDFAVMRTQPGITTVVPADAAQARAAVQATRHLPGPAYFRVSKRGDALPGLDGRFRLGHVEVFGSGRDALIVTIGSIAHEAITTAELLSSRGIDTTVALVSSFNPSPIDEIAELLDDRPVVLTIESHYRDGGLGSLVAETIAERGINCRLIRAGVTQMPAEGTGTQSYLEAQNGLDAATLSATLEKALGVRS
jgi:transketolase